MQKITGLLFCSQKEMNNMQSKWLRISLFNLLVIALLGTVLRYKIAFSLPFVNQRFLLHAHSHFAFSGWVTQALMALLVGYLVKQQQENAFKRYRWILLANLVSAYGMLFTFPFMGYAFLSILFSTLSIFVSYLFAIFFWKDLNRLQQNRLCHSWFKASLFFNVISSIGPFTLAYMMASKNIHQDVYLASVYFFLHFQYDGWFFFACMGLLSFQLTEYGIAGRSMQQAYYLFAAACVPAYFLSVLWLHIPLWVYILVVVASLLQLAGWLLLLLQIRKKLKLIQAALSPLSKVLFTLVAIALSVKLVLQAISVIPPLSRLAFGFRPIVIGYLHLVLLGVISLFIITYMQTLNLVRVNKLSINGFKIFVAGIILNELLLMIQGACDMAYIEAPFINVLLLFAAIVLFSGMLVANVGQMVKH
ncbi:MAG: hypothetical protein JST13_06655, partial [Bacteroidetes bacterium]|nr:hypothetical protein [Bacteroidota bacterium]